MTQQSLSIVIPAFKDSHQLRHCLETLIQSSYADIEIIVVDHAPDDEITRWVSADYPQVTCLRGSPDLWWAGAVNIGIKYALKQGSDFIMPLNHDCYVRKNTIENLLMSLDAGINKIVSPIQFYIHSHKEVVCAYSLFLLGFVTVILPARWCKIIFSNSLLPTGLIIGGRGAIINADIFSTVGYFDEISLPHYCADHDFYLRCKKAGIKLFTCTTAIVEVDDVAEYSGNEKPYHYLRNFKESLLNRSSHRNIKDTWILFTKHLPLKVFAIIGMVLYLVRYSFVYLLNYLSLYLRG